MSEPIKAQAFQMYVSLSNINDPRFFAVDPEIVAGDFTISIDGATALSLTNLPFADPPGSKSVLVDLTAAEMNGSNISIIASDQDAASWEDLAIEIQPFENGNVDTIINLLEGDHTETSVSLTIKKRGTAEVLLQKDISGSLLSPSVLLETSDP